MRHDDEDRLSRPDDRQPSDGGRPGPDGGSGTPAFTERDIRKSSSSKPEGDCVGVARSDGWVEIRDDKASFGAPDDHRLVVTAEEFDHFLTAVRAGELGS